MMVNKSNGFTLLEFLGVMLIVVVLAIIATPIYDTYVKKARFQNVVKAAESYTTPVAVCYQETGALATCSNTSPGVLTPYVADSFGPYVSNVEVTAGKIKATASTEGGLNNETFIINAAGS